MAKKKKTPTVPIKKEKTYTMPTSYLSLLADRITSTRPPKGIILHTLKEVWLEGRDSGYFGQIRQAKDFRNGRDNVIKEMFDALQDRIDDNIHSKNEKNN